MTDPLVPVTLITYRPDGVEADVAIVRPVDPDDPGVRGTFASAIEAVRPRFDGTERVRWTLAPRPRLPSEIVEVAELPAKTLAG